MDSLGELIVSMVPRSRINPDHGATATRKLENALEFLDKTIPNFRERLAGRTVLDYGCGHGLQVCALAKLKIPKAITGVDIRLFDEMGKTARTAGVEGEVEFVSEIPPGRTFDVVYSSSSFEHFDNPEAELRRMIGFTRPGGEVLISFAEPWFSPHGSHMTGYTGLPWSNLLFSEKTLMKVRSKYRSDGATRYHEVAGGLNKMTVARFEKIMNGVSECTVEQIVLRSTKGLPLVTGIPVLRELFTAAATCILRRKDA
jgi:SAM-dependent methyltransferase